MGDTRGASGAAMARQSASARPKLGQHLEWHGNQIRVVVRVPPSLKPQLGAHLRESLNTRDPRLAEVLKHNVVGKLKREIYEARHGSKDDPVIQEALKWREEIRDEESRVERGEIPPHDTVIDMLMVERAHQLERDEGFPRAKLFAEVAQGLSTPLETFLDEWIASKLFTGRTESARRYALKHFEGWCKASQVAPALEEITSKIAARYVTEAWEQPQADPETANKYIGGLSSYWQWLLAKEHLDPEKHRNVWAQKRLARRKRHRDEHERGKRPFTDEEVRTLLAGVTTAPLDDMCRIAALSGLRIDEIAGLRVGHIKDDLMRVQTAKSAAGQRDVPIHPDLVDTIERRVAGKALDDYLIQELPKQKTDKRGRSAPATQAFVRVRRALGVNDQPPGARQSRVDFHSWRRWFIRKAREALEKGDARFTPWTIADVVGHSAGDEPLGMTMVRYPGKASLEAMRACVAAVRLPSMR